MQRHAISEQQPTDRPMDDRQARERGRAKFDDEWISMDVDSRLSLGHTPATRWPGRGPDFDDNWISIYSGHQ